jgi:hypothetical protein
MVLRNNRISMDMYQKLKQHFHLNLERGRKNSLGLIMILLAVDFKKPLLIAVVL